jgi:methyl-accepting chemotaxis protein WspA
LKVINTMKGWTIRRRIVASFAVTLALMMVMATVAYTRLARIEQLTGGIEKDILPGLNFSNQIMVERMANYSLTQEYGLETDAAMQQRLRAAILASRTYMVTLVEQYGGSIDSPGEQKLFESFKSAQTLYVSAQDEVLAARMDPNSRGEVVKKISARLYPEFEKTGAAAGALVDHNKEEAVDSIRLIAESVLRAKGAVLLSVGVGLAVAFFCGYFLLRAITRPLGRLVTVLDGMRTGDLSGRLNVDRADEFGTLAAGFNRMTDELAGLVGQVQQSGIQVNTSVTEIAASAREQQATASQIAATTIEIGATSREISATSKELVRTMNEVTTVAERTATLAGDGQAGLTRMEGTMRHVMDAAGSINAKLAVLNEKAGSINQVVTTITKVADQTNLLSLNAAIEAEKAGEYGRGFAVVATEIRRLADQTAVATYDIEQMVKDIQSAVSAGVMGMDKFSEEVRRGMQEVQQVGGQLSEIIRQVQALAPRFEAVNEGMGAQATGAEQITQALAQLSEAAQQTVESLHQSRQAIEGLNQAASSMRSGVSRFKLAA